MAKTEFKTIAQNKKAYHDYFVEETLEAGMGVYREMTLLYMPMFLWKISTEQDENRLKGVSNYAE